MGIKICYLHGFLGQPEDFATFHEHVSHVIPSAHEVWAPNLWQTPELSPKLSLKEWTNTFLKQLTQRSRSHLETTSWFLVGYSMGGRLALNAVMQQPELFQGALLLSTDPGTADDQQRHKRREWTALWQERFLNWPWLKLMAAWNEQEVFQASSNSLARLETHYDRELLSLSLANWSWTQHLFTWEDLKTTKVPLHWLFGEHYTKFMSICAQLRSEKIPTEQRVIQGAGHRLLWEAPESCAQTMREVFCG